MLKRSYLVFVEFNDGRKPIQEEFQAKDEFGSTNHDAQNYVQEKYGYQGYQGIAKIRLFREINHRVDRGGYDH